MKITVTVLVLMKIALTMPVLMKRSFRFKTRLIQSYQNPMD